MNAGVSEKGKIVNGQDPEEMKLEGTELVMDSSDGPVCISQSDSDLEKPSIIANKDQSTIPKLSKLKQCETKL